MNEIWKYIDGYDNRYQISNTGKVKNLLGERVLSISNCGYVRVGLCKNSKIKQESIHRLVAKYFIPNIDNKQFVNHKDGNKLNNSVENLEWVTLSENMKHSYKNGLHIISDKHRKVASEQAKKRIGEKNPISKKVKNTVTGDEFVSISEAAKKYNKTHSCLSHSMRTKKNKYNLIFV